MIVVNEFQFCSEEVLFVFSSKILIWVLFEFHLVFIWVSFGFHLGFIWVSFGFHLGFILVSFGFHLGFIWVSFRFQLGFFWVSFRFQWGSIWSWSNFLRSGGIFAIVFYLNLTIDCRNNKSYKIKNFHFFFSNIFLSKKCYFVSLCDLILLLFEWEIINSYSYWSDDGWCWQKWR